MLNPEIDISFDTEPSAAKKSKKQQLVKHKRKNWKKTDLDDVEQGIDDYRQQQLTGGLKADKKDDELFYINKTKLPLNEAGDVEPSSKRPKRLTLEEKMSNLNCYKNLQPDPNSLPAHVVRSITKPDRDSKRQTKLDESKTKKMQRVLSTRSRQNSYCAKLAAELKDMKDEGENLERKKRRKSKVLTPDFKEGFEEKKLNVHLASEFSKDIWSGTMANDGTDLPDVTKTNEYYLRGLKKIPFRKPKNPLYKESLIAKVEAPHPGHSYNPDFDDHQALLLKAHEVELKKLKEEQKLMRRLAASAKKMSWAELEKRWMEEMSVRDLFEPKSDEDEDNETEEEENDKGKTNVASVSKRELRRREKAIHIGRKADTRAKREKKKMMEKIKLRQKENEKQMKIQQNEIFRLKSLKKEVDADLKKVDENTEKNKEAEATKLAYGQKRLGKLKYEEAELDLQLSEEITGNLRTLRPEGNILRDRYKSFQKRNLIEPREKSTGLKDKYSKKKFQKRTAYEVTNYIR